MSGFSFARRKRKAAPEGRGKSDWVVWPNLAGTDVREHIGHERGFIRVGRRDDLPVGDASTGPRQAERLMRGEPQAATHDWAVDARAEAFFQSLEHGLASEGKRPRGRSGRVRRIQRPQFLHLGTRKVKKKTRPRRGAPGAVSR